MATRPVIHQAPGPDRLVLIRHAESVGNVAARTAHEQGAGQLQLDARDADVELSETGEQQAEGVGKYLASLGPGERPTVVLSSPYRRAAGTAEVALRLGGGQVPVHLDERLRERDLGIFDRLTGVGIRADHPQEADRRRRLGKFYYRPPSGESWCDVALRVRSLMADLRDRYDGERLWVFSHQAVIMSFRVVLEGLEERDILTIDADTPLANCSFTTYERTAEGALRLLSYGDTAAVDQAAAAHHP